MTKDELRQLIRTEVLAALQLAVLPNIVSPDKVYTTKEAASYLKVKVATLQKARREGRVHGFQADAKSWRFKHSELVKYQESSTSKQSNLVASDEPDSIVYSRLVSNTYSQQNETKQPNPYENQVEQNEGIQSNKQINEVKQNQTNVFGSTQDQNLPSLYNTNSISDNNIEGKKSKSRKGDATKSKRFVPPTEQEVYEYMKSCKAKPESWDDAHTRKQATRFWNYYDSKGWTVGRDNRKMTKWTSAVNGWLSRAEEYSHKPNSNAKQNSNTGSGSRYDARSESKNYRDTAWD